VKRLIIGFAVLPFLTGIASAAQPVLLSDAQMDKVTAGENSAIIIGDAGGISLAIGNIAALSATITSTLTSQAPHDIGVAESAAKANAASAITASFVVVGSNAVVTLAFTQ
jgi:hypothetical protein